MPDLLPARTLYHGMLHLALFSKLGSEALDAGAMYLQNIERQTQILLQQI